jgi:alpha-amylase/alpha-mannosidase (GH57 family)
MVIEVEEAAPVAAVPVHEGGPGPPIPVEGGTLFTFDAPDAMEVYVAGEFNGWSPTADLMEKDKDGVWAIVLPLDTGRYEYKFVIDGVWQEDPNNPEMVPDPYGGNNSVLMVGEVARAPAKTAAAKVAVAVVDGDLGSPVAVKGGIRFTFEAPDANEVYVAGEFNGWSPTADLMTKGDDGIWRIILPVGPGRYEYKFVVDGNWQEDPQNPDSVPDPYGGSNSVLNVSEDGKVQTGAAIPPVAPDPKKPIVGSLKGKGKPLYVALLWHQHQPKYMKDPATGEYAEPWVRVHAIKDYYDMTAILGDYPGMKFTVNLTPVLLMQLEEVIEGYDRWRELGTQYMPGADKWIRLTLTPPDKLTYDEKAYILRNFFRMPWGTMLNIYPRFKELASKKLGDSDEQIATTIDRYTDQDWRDLQAWFNLAEFDPDFKEGEVTLPNGLRVGVGHLMKKERGFTEVDKREIIDTQMEIMKAVLQVHKKYQDKGQLEVITTPFYHPILPLIYDTDLARVAMPGVPLPEPAYRWPEDASAHLSMAQENYRENFGRSAKGLWAAEGSVAEDIVPLVADAGFGWMASDEEVLAASLKGRPFGDSEKYQAWWTEKDGKRVAVLFRDRAISDAIGFNYSKMGGVEAANDLMQRLYRIHKSFATKPGVQVVPIILDGENAWEHYQRDGKDFFHSMYSQMTSASWLVPVTIADFLEKHPPEETIDVLWPGSWIAHNFATWIGEPEENEGWSLLAETRSALEEYRKTPGADPVAVGEAFREMYAAEGSDWFWWYGKDQSSGNDEFFDEAFRSALRNVYTAMGQEPPSKLWTPIVMPAAATPERRVLGHVTPVIDGTMSFGEWSSAGLIDDEEGGVMQRGEGDFIREVFYGYDKDDLYLAVKGSWPGEFGTLSVYFSLPKGEESNGFARGSMVGEERISFGFGLGSMASFFAEPGTSGPLEFRTALGSNRWSDPEEVGKFARGKGTSTAELMIPFSALGASSLEPLRFSVTLTGKAHVIDIAPNRGGVEMVVPEQGDVTTLLSIDDPKGDDHGPGTYTYPTNPVFQPGVYDVENLTVMEDPGGWIIFKTRFSGPVENPWGGRDGYSVQGIDIYLDTDGQEGSGSRDLFENRLARTTPESAWEYFVRVCMDEVAIYGDPQTLLSDSEVLVRADPATSTITARVPVSVVGKPNKNWKIIIAVVSHEGLFSPGKVRAVLPTATEWEFGGGDGKGPNIIDLVIQGGESQQEILSSYKRTGSVAEIPGIPLGK